MNSYCSAVCWHCVPVLAELGTGSKDVQRDWTAARSCVVREGELGKQSEGLFLLLIEAVIEEGNHVDESVRHLQNGSLQSSLVQEGAVPVWVGMGWLETKRGELLNPYRTLPDTR